MSCWRLRKLLWGLMLQVAIWKGAAGDRWRAFQEVLDGACRRRFDQLFGSRYPARQP